MTKSLTKVVYKPDTQSTDEFIVIVNPAEFKKWKAGDRTIPLAEVVDSFKVFYSNQGAQGILGTPSKQQLDTIFGTTKDVDVMTQILEKGKDQAGNGFTSGMTATNVARGSFSIDSKGKGLTGI
jgi:ribosome maturation protein Sdo1